MVYYMNSLRSIVKAPRLVRDEIKINVFVEELKNEIEKLNQYDRKKYVFDIVAYIMNLAEVYFHRRNVKMGHLKRKAVISVLSSTEDENEITKLIELVLKSNQLQRVSRFIRLKYYFLKKIATT